ncbi:MAG: glycoside hydrolase family 3 N-terminal domain-containing protein [Dehalococcoidia bacterium]
MPTLEPSRTPAATVALDEMIAQMVMVGFRGLTVRPDDPVAADLSHHLGSTVLFDTDVPTGSAIRNVQSPDQLANLTAELQALSSPPPVLVAVDQEGGNVARLGPTHGFPATLSEGELGRRDDLNLTCENAQTIASTLRTAGINLNLAPVVDLNVNPSNPIIGALDRSFSADPNVVTRHALEEIRTHHDAGILATLKHFPGHGSSTGDSHLGFVDVTNTWSHIELEPFANIIAASQADVVMTAHIFNANLDPDFPATLSFATIDGVLRGELGFQGVVISDDMQMRAISDRYGFEDAIRLAVLAGVDIIAIANNSVYEEGVATRAMQVIRAAIDSGAISAERIEASYNRITMLKARIA